MGRQLKLIFAIGFFTGLLLFSQNCAPILGGDGGGTTAGDPASNNIPPERLAGFSSYNDYLAENGISRAVGDGEYIRSVELCLDRFTAVEVDGTRHEINFDSGERPIVTLDPDGTLIGFLDEEELPPGNYTAEIRLGPSCGETIRERFAMRFENSYGEFLWQPTGFAEIPPMEFTRSLVNDQLIWTAQVQDFIDTLAGIQSTDEILCKMQPFTPGCVQPDPPGTEPNVRLLRLCILRADFIHENGQVYRTEGFDRQDFRVDEQGHLDNAFFTFDNFPEGNYTMNTHFSPTCTFRIGRNSTFGILHNGYGVFGERVSGDRNGIQINLTRNPQGRNIWRSSTFAEIYDAAKDVQSNEAFNCLILDRPGC